MQLFDKIILGTSPIALVESAFLKSKGFSVLNIDERPKIGGAWTTIKFSDFPEVEIGCHIWSYNKEVYNLLAELFQLNLKALSPQPAILIKGKKIPYDWKSNVISAQRIVKNLGKLREMFTSPDIRFSLLPSKYLYPEKGALDLKNALLSFVQKHQLLLQLNLSINKVIVKESLVELYSEEDYKIGETKQLVLTSLSNLRKIVFNDGSFIVPKTRKVNYIHAHLILEHVSGKPFSYLRTNGDSRFHRVSDMTSQVQSDLKANQKLFCVGLFPDFYYNKTSEELKAEIFDFFLKNKLISAETKIVGFETNIFPSYYNELSIMESVGAKSKGKIRFLRSTDFVYSFYNYKNQYKTLLSDRSK